MMYKKNVKVQSARNQATDRQERAANNARLSLQFLKMFQPFADSIDQSNCSSPIQGLRDQREVLTASATKLHRCLILCGTGRAIHMIRTIPTTPATLPPMKASACAVLARAALVYVRRKERRYCNVRLRYDRLADRALYRRRLPLDGRW